MLPSLRTLLLPAIAALAVTNGQQARANNIQVSNTTLINNGSTAWIQFDLSWQNSWNGGVVNNWDAAWVFVKYNTVNDPTWRHAFLSPGGTMRQPACKWTRACWSPRPATIGSPIP